MAASLTEEELARLRDAAENAEERERAGIVGMIGVRPWTLRALLDAADENERLRALLGEASQMIGALAAGLFDEETRDAVHDDIRGRIAEELEK